MSRLACSAVGCRFVHWDNPIPVIAGVVRWRDHYVLARNTNWPLGVFSMITGFLERNEVPEQALRREIKEELGLRLEASSFIGHYALPQANQLIVAFHAEADGELVAGSDIVEAKTLTKEALLKYDFGPLGLTARIVRDAAPMILA
ncbi:MAG TPA: NUDIX domain-containing protein [Polyangia bacterium]